MLNLIKLFTNVTQNFTKDMFAFHFLRSARSVLDNGNPIEYSVSKPASVNLISPVSYSSLRSLALLNLIFNNSRIISFFAASHVSFSNPFTAAPKSLAVRGLTVCNSFFAITESLAKKKLGHRPTSANDLSDVAVNLAASPEPGANLDRRSCNIMSLLTLFHCFALNLFTAALGALRLLRWVTLSTGFYSHNQHP